MMYITVDLQTSLDSGSMGTSKYYCTACSVATNQQIFEDRISILAFENLEIHFQEIKIYLNAKIGE